MQKHIIIIFCFIIILFTLFYDTIKDKDYENFEVINVNGNESLNTLINENLRLTTLFNNPNFKNFNIVTHLDTNIEYILVIDMPNYGGGTTFFINSIIFSWIVFLRKIY